MGLGLFALVGSAETVRSVVSLHSEAFTVLVKAESPVKKIDDLRNKRFNVGPIGTGTRETADAILDALGWTAADRANVTDLEPDQGAAALCNGQVDAVAYLVGHPSSSIEQQSKACPVRLISMLHTTTDKLLQDRPFYAVVEIPGGLYAGNPQPVTTLGVKATIVTLATVPDTVVYALTASVFEKLDELQKSSPAFASLDPAQMLVGLTAPLHAGALKYFREKGWPVPKDLSGDSSAAVAPSGMDEVGSPGAMVLKPPKPPTVPDVEVQLPTTVLPPVSKAPLREKERWETDPGPR